MYLSREDIDKLYFLLLYFYALKSSRLSAYTYSRNTIKKGERYEKKYINFIKSVITKWMLC